VTVASCITSPGSTGTDCSPTLTLH
jgi:hypothetical protein